MNSHKACSPRSAGRRRRRATTNNDLVVIDGSSESDDDDDDVDLLVDRKPAAKKTDAGIESRSAKKKDGSSQCISLLVDSSDEENNPNGAAAARTKKRNRDEEATDRELAKKLQRMEEDGARKADKREDTRRKRRNKEEEAADREMAEKLQRMEENAARKASASEERRQMAKSSDGKAVLAVQEIIALVKAAKERFIDSNRALQRHNVEAVTIDDMVFMAKNMLDKQEEFIHNQISGYIGVSCDLLFFSLFCHYRAFAQRLCGLFLLLFLGWTEDVGYHYTDQRNIVNIRTHGLLTSAERQSNKVQAAPKGRCVWKILI